MTNIDKTNIYSYRGKDFAGDLMNYLNNRGASIIKVSVNKGWIEVTSHTMSSKIPQYTIWGQIWKGVRE